VQATDYLKQKLSRSIEDSIVLLKDKISGDLLNLELSILYDHKLYGQDAQFVQNTFDELAVGIDIALNECLEHCTGQIEDIIDRRSSEIKLRNEV
jgi:hypothetical protein